MTHPGFVLLLACAALFVVAPAAPRASGPDPAQPFELEYRRTYPTGERVSVRASRTGWVTGSATGVDGRAGSALEGWLPPGGRLLAELTAAGLWEEKSEPLGEDVPGVRITVRAAGAEHVCVLGEARLAEAAAIRRALAACEVRCGAGSVLGRGWLRAGDAARDASDWAKAIAAYRAGSDRVPPVVAVVGPEPGLEGDVPGFRDRPEEECRLRRQQLEGLIGIAELALAEAVTARFCADDRLWPDEWRPAWPWDWTAPAAGFQPQMLGLREAPATGARYARPAGWEEPKVPEAQPGAPQGFPEAAYLGRQSVPGAQGDSGLDLWCLETTADFGLSERLEALLQAAGAKVVRQVERGRARLQMADLVGRNGERALRWVAVQSGRHLVLGRWDLEVTVMEAHAAECGRLTASLEPRPLGSGACAEPVQEAVLAGDARARLLVPAAWKAEVAAGAPPRAEYRDWVGDGHRLAVRCFALQTEFAWDRVWATVGPPGKAGRLCAGLAGVSGNEIVSRVRTPASRLVEVRRSRVKVGEEEWPAFWFGSFQPERALVVVLVAGGDDSAAMSRARALAERIAASVSE